MVLPLQQLGLTGLTQPRMKQKQQSKGNLTTMEGFVLRCKKGTVADTTNVTYNGWSGNTAAFYIHVVAFEDGIHDGTAGSGYRLECSSGHCLETLEEYTRIGEQGAGHRNTLYFDRGF